MNNTDKMVAILRQLKVEKNGAVVDAMRDLGIEYPLSYGVSIPTIRQIAKPYAPDHQFAKYLYQQNIRELKLAALSIAEPSKITEEELDFWAKGVTNNEVAEHLAALLMSESKITKQLFDCWLQSDDETLRYSALLAMARHLMIAKDSPEIEVRKTFGILFSVLDTENRSVWIGVARLIAILERHYPETKVETDRMLEQMREQKYGAADYLKEELHTVWYEE